MKPATIIAMPSGTLPDLEALQREFGHTVVQHNWHPSRQVIPGVLHITCMHPDDLRAAGCHEFIERGWHAQPVAMPHRQRGRAHPNLLLILIGLWISVCIVTLTLGASHYLDHWQDLFGPDDVATAQLVADDKTTAEQAAAQQQRFDAIVQLRCGPNAIGLPLGNGAVQCETKRGYKTIVVWGGYL